MYSENKRHRDYSSIAFTQFSILNISCRSLLVLSLVIINLPVLHGCYPSMLYQDGGLTAESPQSAVKVAVHNIPAQELRHTDVLVFNNDPLQRMECYQRFEGSFGDELKIGSQKGEKIMVICANSHWDEDDWKSISSYSGVAEFKADLENESSEFPLLTATTELAAGSNGSNIAILETLTAEVVLNSICFDFKDRPYRGEKVSDIKVYLTNVNATCSILTGSHCSPERIINHGRLMNADMEEFADSRILMRSISYPVGSERIYPDFRFICYGNTAREESIGSPFTRLVIEGTISGETWYWPITINRGCGNDHEGIKRNTTYGYDITIRRKGSKNPDTPVELNETEIQLEVGQWEEKDGYTVGF